MRHLQKSIFILISVFFLNACQTFQTAVFDQYAYQKTIEIKVDTETLLEKATTPYVDNLDEVEDLQQEIKRITEYEKNRPNNEVSHAMWRFIGSENKKFVGGFLKLWRDNGTLSEAFIPEASGQINEAFNMLIDYEMKKDKNTELGILRYINAN